MLKGYQFDRERVSPQADALVNHYMGTGRIGVIPEYAKGMKVSSSGRDLTISNGLCVIYGRAIEVVQPEIVNIPPNSTGYLAVTVDLSQINDSSGTVGMSGYSVMNNQIRTEFITELIQDDLLNGGILYTLNLGAVSSTLTTLNFVKNMDAYIPGNDGYKYVLSAANWANGFYAVNDPSITTNPNLMKIWPELDESAATQPQRAAWLAANIWTHSQADGSVTFRAWDGAPTINLPIVIKMRRYTL